MFDVVMAMTGKSRT